MKILLSLALLLSSFPLFGQATTGYHRVSQVIARSNTGTTALVVPFAKIAVTNTATGNAAVIYFDPLLSSQITPPLITADLAGNYSYYMPLNTCVTETISAPGQSNITIPNICGNPASSVLLETNGVNNAQQNLLNLVAGTGIVLSNTGGAVTINAQAGSGVTSINTVTGAFTFSGSDVSCSGTTCTFSGGGGGGSPGGSNHSVQFNSSSSFAGTAFNGLVKASTTADPVAAVAGTDFQAPITLTTTGTSGAATFIGNTLNVPQYAGTTYSAGTGLTLTGSTFSVNTSQNIATLSNLTSNGFVKTSGGAGTLSVDTTVYAPLTSPTFLTGITTPAITLSTATGSTQCLQVNTSGVVAPTGTPCGSGGGGITALTGDGTASGSGSVAFTLATVNSNVGSFGSSTSIPSFTVNAKGLITAASGNVVIAPAGTLSGTTLNSTVVSSSLTSLGTIISLLANNITDSALTSGNCVQASTSGLLTTTSAACGSGGGGIPIVGLPNINTYMQNLQLCSTQICNIVIFGDSFAIADTTNVGDGPVTSTNRWAEQLRIAWQATYGSHGTGIVPTNVGYTTTHSAATLNNEAWSCTGTTDFSTGTLGPSQSVSQAQNSLLHMGNGAVCTFHDLRGIQWGGSTGGLNTYCMTTAASGSLAISIDSGAVTGTACGSTTGSATAHAISLADATLSTHSVTFTSTGDSYLYGAEGTTGTSGVSVHLVAVSGSLAEMFNSANKLVFTDLIPSGTQMAIVPWLTNDVNFAESTTNFGTYLTTIINHEIALSGTPPVMLKIDPVTNIYSSGAQIPYVAVELNLCATLAISCVNIQDHWGTTYTNLNSLWASGHPNDKGSLGEFTQVFESLKNPVPLQASSAPVNGVSPTAATPAVTATNTASAAVVFASTSLCPNLTAGQYCINLLDGVDSATNNNAFFANYHFTASGSSSNYEQFNFTGNVSGGEPMVIWPTGDVWIDTPTQTPSDPGFALKVGSGFTVTAAGAVAASSAVAATPAGVFTNSDTSSLNFSSYGLCPSMTTTTFCVLGIGRDTTNTNNSAGFDFNYIGSGSASNNLQINFIGGSTALDLFPNGHVKVAGTGDPGTAFGVGSSFTVDSSGNTILNNLTVNGTCTGCGGGGITFPQTVGGTTTSGGIPYFSSTTVLSSSALLPTGDFVLGGGAGGSPTASFSVVPVTNGGSGAGTFTIHGVLLGQTTGTFHATAAGASNAVFMGQGAADPIFVAQPVIDCTNCTNIPTGLSGMTTGQVAIAGSASTITSSKALAGSGAGITTGPASGVISGDLASLTGTGGQIADSSIIASQVVTAASGYGVSILPKSNGGGIGLVASLFQDNGTFGDYLGSGFVATILSTSINLCADTSASGTAQVCNTVGVIVPVAGTCVTYTTTTSNSGAGLTLNVNSLGAKSVAKWQGTTTLAAGDVPANSPQLACYSGTVWNLSNIGNAPSGGGGTTWNAITNPTGNLSLTMGSDTSLFTYGSTTSTANLWEMTDGSANTGTGLLMYLHTGATSALNPFAAFAKGTTNPALYANSSNNVGIHNTGSATVALGIGTSGSSGAAEGLMFDGDTSADLYRPFSGELETDGGMTVAGGVSSNTFSARTFGAGQSFAPDNFGGTSGAVFTFSAPVAGIAAGAYTLLSVSGTTNFVGTTTGSWGGISNTEVYGSATTNIYNGSAPIEPLNISPTFNVATTSSAGYRAVNINPTETSVSTQTNFLLWAGVGGTAKATIDSKGTGLFVGTVTSALGNAAITSATGGTGVTSVTCATATCNVSRGSYTVVGGTATTGTIITLLWPTTTTAWVCSVDMNGGTGFLGIGHSVATATGMNITAGLTVVGVTFIVDYNCVP